MVYYIEKQITVLLVNVRFFKDYNNSNKDDGSLNLSSKITATHLPQ
jgi:hypothetical protein